jgi:ThiF family
VGEAKVNVAAKLAVELGFGSKVTTIEGKVTEEEVAAVFADCDAIFGCTDDHAGRGVLSRLAYWYLLPVFDVGVVVDSEAGRIRGVFARLTIAAPGYPCLICRGVVDPIAMRNDMLTPGERAAREAEGYAPELGDPDPAVVSYTSLIAALAVSEFLSRLFGIGDENSAPGELLFRIHDHKLSSVAGTARPGHYCGSSAEWARGDEVPLLGQTW